MGLDRKLMRWHKQYSRGSICVEYRREYGFGFSACVTAHGWPEHPFPTEPKHVKAWHVYVMIPGESSFPTLAMYKPEGLFDAIKRADMEAEEQINVMFDTLQHRAAKYKTRGKPRCIQNG